MFVKNENKKTYENAIVFLLFSKNMLCNLKRKTLSEAFFRSLTFCLLFNLNFKRDKSLQEIDEGFTKRPQALFLYFNNFPRRKFQLKHDNINFMIVN